MDIVRTYNKNSGVKDPFSLSVKRTSYVGYTIEAYRSNSNFSPIIEHIAYPYANVSNYGVFDIDDNPVEDVRNLERDKQYKYEWYLGTQYNEVSKVANCRCYISTKDNDEVIVLPGTPTKNGYGEVIMDLEPGFYTCQNVYCWVPFEIVE